MCLRMQHHFEVQGFSVTGKVVLSREVIAVTLLTTIHSLLSNNCVLKLDQCLFDLFVSSIYTRRVLQCQVLK